MQKERGERGVAYGLATDDSLVKFREGQLYGHEAVMVIPATEKGLVVPERKGANWEEWCAGMDGLGGLVILAANLVG